MDIALLSAAAIPFIGYYLNKGTGKTVPKENIRSKIPLEERGNGDNVYESTRFTEVDKYERGLVDNSWERAKDPVNTNIIPGFYNTMGGQITNYNPVRNTDINPIINKPSRLRSDIGTDIKYTGDKNTEIRSEPFKTDSRGVPQRGIEGFFTVSGPQNSSNPKEHNNMVPYFKGQIKQNMDPYAHQSALEAFTGQTGNVTENRAVSKEEVPYMFAPQAGLTYPYGTPNLGNYGRERYITSELKTNVSAIPTTRVGPGVDYGGPGVNGAPNNYQSAPRDGFHPMYRVVEKNIDELRVNKKPTLEGRTVSGQKARKRGVLGFVQKKTPDTYYINTPDRWFTTAPGEYQLPAFRENFDPDHTNRAETTVSYSGPAYGNEADHATYTTPMERNPHRNNTDAIPPANVAGQDKVIGNFGVTGYQRINNMLVQERTGNQKGPKNCANDDGTETAAGAQRIGVFRNVAPTVPIGRARTTIKETTVRANKDYMGIAGPATDYPETNKSNYYDGATTINDLKEVTLLDRRPGGHGDAPKNALGADNVVISMKYRENYDQTGRLLSTKTYPTPTNYAEVGRIRSNPNTSLAEISGIRQPEDYLVQQFRNNPYTKSLNAAPPMTVRNCEPSNC